ncbi:MAG: glucan biosynthesis protein [Hyphomicrobiales bacterium]
MRRRDVLGAGAALFSTSMLGFAAKPALADVPIPISLLEAARSLSQCAYMPHTAPLRAPFADLSYDAYRGIRPRPGLSAMLPHGDEFAADLLPPGLYFPSPVTIDRATPDGLQEIAFRPDLFSFEPRYFDSVPETSPGAGFSGMRLRYGLNDPDRLDEVLVMQGASYFRAIGQAMVYGLSARAVAIGTGGSQPEEFPRFTHLRLHEPSDGAVRVEGLIDSHSLAGHIDMTLRPGANTDMQIAVTLFPRVEIDTIGVAPLTSMYLKGPLRASVSDDFRPRVHDSDVLFIENGAGERLWRPIANPAEIESSAFVDDSPASFGLFQTARSFEDFEDTEARYHDRPSALVRPTGDWGRGAVMLIEIPTGDEFLDNIVAFWRPEAALEAGGEYSFAYQLTWTRDAPDTASLAPIVQSRSGQEHDRPGTRRFVVDFDTDVASPVPDITTSNQAEISGVSAFLLPNDRGTRVTFLLTPGQRDAVDVRLSLRLDDGTPISPVWLHRWTRARDGGV